MENEKNWEDYISGYITKYGLGPLLGQHGSEVLRMDRFIVIGIDDVRVTLCFRTRYRQVLDRISFRNGNSPIKVSLSFVEEGGRPFYSDNRNMVEGFLNMPLVHGWVEDITYVRGIPYRTRIYRGCNGKGHFCTLRGRPDLRRRLMYLFRHGVTRSSTPYKGALHRYGDGAHPSGRFGPKVSGQ